MSRFFARGSSSSDTDTESSFDINECSSEDEPIAKEKSKYLTSKYSKKVQSESSEESSDSENIQTRKRTSKSQLERQRQDFLMHFKSIQTATTESNWVSISNDFDKCIKLLDKYKPPMSKSQGLSPLGFPEEFIQVLVFIDNQLSIDIDIKKSSSDNAKALISVKQKFKKLVPIYESDMTWYRQNFKPSIQDDQQPYTSTSSESDQEISFQVKPQKSAADKWKKIQDLKNTSEKTIKTKKVPKHQKQEREMISEEERTMITTEEDSISITPSNIMKKLLEIMAARGKKGTDRADQIDTLRFLLSMSSLPMHRIYILFVLISNQFDYGSASSIYALPIDLWKNIEQDIQQLLNMLEFHSLREFIIPSSEISIISGSSYAFAHDEWIDKLFTLDGVTNYVVSSLLTSVSRLDDDLIKSLLSIDSHSGEYADRLKDEIYLYSLLVRTQSYLMKLYNENNDGMILDSLCQMLLRRLEHVYMKPKNIINLLEDTLDNLPSSVVNTPIGHYLPLLPFKNSSLSNGFFLTSNVLHKDELPSKIIYHLACYLYAYGGDRSRTRAMLSHIYYASMNDCYDLARELFLASHIQESIAHADVSTQIMYNRAVVQIGLAAFRQGRMKDCQSILQDIFALGRQRDLLGQNLGHNRFGSGLDRQQLQSGNMLSEQEKQERLRQLPFHMHIHLELLETVYFVSSLLVEVPYVISTGLLDEGNSRRYNWQSVNKHFKRILEAHDRSIYTGPPETTRDFIIEATKAFLGCDWKECAKWIRSIPIWKLFTDSGMDSDKLHNMLRLCIQEEVLHAYLLSAQRNPCSVKMSYLANAFELDPNRIYQLVCSWIFTEELIYVWIDEYPMSGDSCLLHFDPPIGAYPRQIRLQELAKNLSDKMSLLFDENERMYEHEYGGLQTWNTHHYHHGVSHKKTGGSHHQATSKQHQSLGSKREIYT